MKIILSKNVKNVGKAGQVVDVSDGYGRNFILAKKLGVIATTGAMKQRETAKKEKIDSLKAEIKLFIDQKNIIEAETFEIVATADAKGAINGNISPKQIVDSINKTTGIKIDKKNVEKKLISGFGISKLDIELFKGINANVKINVRRK